MNPSTADYLKVALLGGPAGAIAMYAIVRVLNAAGWVKGDIILAIGSIFLHRRRNAVKTGWLLHFGAAVVFAPVYLLVLAKFGLTAFPAALGAGMLIGLFHGIFVTLGLVWVASNEPMLPEFTGARLPLAVMHCAGHLAYGAVVGLVISLLG